MRVFIVLTMSLGVAVGLPQITPQYGVPSGRVVNSQGSSGEDTSSQHDFNLIAGALESSSSQGDSSDFEDTSGGFIPSSGSSSSLSLEEMEAAVGSPKVYKHISIHIPPKEEFDVPMRRVIRPMSQPDKHVNIIFVKAPSASSSQMTEVILPEENQQRTVVYVLLKKSEASSDIKIRQPAPAKPPRPEVFFVKYETAEGQQAGATGDAKKPEYGVPQ